MFKKKIERLKEELDSRRNIENIVTIVTVRFQNVIPGDYDHDKFTQSYSKTCEFRSSKNREERIALFIRKMVDINNRLCKRRGHVNTDIKANLKFYLHKGSELILLTDKIYTLIEC